MNRLLQILSVTSSEGQHRPPSVPVKMRILRFLRSSLSVGKDIDYYSKFSPSPLSMKQFLDFGKKNLHIYASICNMLRQCIPAVLLMITFKVLLLK